MATDPQAQPGFGWAIFDKHTGQPISKFYPFAQQAWTDAMERKFLTQGWRDSNGEGFHLLHSGYEIKQGPLPAEPVEAA